jgi:hypothetical protein
MISLSRAGESSEPRRVHKERLKASGFIDQSEDLMIKRPVLKFPK